MLIRWNRLLIVLAVLVGIYLYYALKEAGFNSVFPSGAGQSPASSIDPAVVSFAYFCVILLFVLGLIKLLRK